MLVASMVIYAGSMRKETIDIYKNDIKIVVNGQEIQIKDGIEPFIHEGTTYLSVRAVSEALGENVDWDQDSYTVIIGQNAKVQNKVDQQLEVVDFELDVKYANDKDIELDYEKKSSGYEAEYEDDFINQKLKGQQALEKYAKVANIDFRTDQDSVSKAILNALGLDQNYRKFELE